jgi:Uma2 family endonuclease
VLHNISWETFEALLAETGEDRGSRFAYEDGTLEIMTPLFEHENPKIQFDRFILILAEELEIEIEARFNNIEAKNRKKRHRTR